jgi:membrane protease YdiL (CAAX protease family)
MIESPSPQPLSRKVLCLELFSVLCLGVFAHLIVAVSLFLGTTETYRTFAWDQYTVIVFSLQVAVPTLYIVSRSPGGFAEFGLVAPRIFPDLYIGLAAFAIAWCLPAFTIVFVPPWLIPVLNQLIPKSPVMFEKPLFVAEYMLLFVALAVNAFTEELVTRAYLITRLSHLGLPRIASVFVSSTLFASYHLYQGAWAVFQMFFFGLFLSLLYLWVGRLLPLVIAHLLYGYIAYLQFQPT